MSELCWGQGNIDIDDYREAFSMACGAVSRIIPKDVLITEYGSGWRYKCPTCESRIALMNSYCRYCGQRLEWEDDDLW